MTLACRKQLHRLGFNYGTEKYLMFFVAALLDVLSGLSDAAGNHEIGFGADVCRYGSTFPAYVLAGAALAAIWGAFVSVR
jgi:hypothetical protein